MSQFHESDPVVDRKSKFQGRAVKLSTQDQIPTILNQLLEDKKIRKSSHPHIYAWRLANSQGYNDNGEKGAGTRLLENALVRNGVVGALVIVTRWMGGGSIGPARFRHIVSVGIDSLKKGGFIK